MAKHYALDASHQSRSPSPYRPYIGVSIGVPPASLLLGQGGDEFAAELRDVWDNAAPARVGGDRETLKYVSDHVLGRPQQTPGFQLVWTVVCPEAREKAKYEQRLPLTRGIRRGGSLCTPPVCCDRASILAMSRSRASPRSRRGYAGC